jgi:glucose-1-phosphate thymidylyltransferase
MKGVILAGGLGTRLRPMTSIISKQMLPVYDKPLVYYPLATLLLSGINEILIITSERDQEQYRELLEPFVNLGVRLSFVIQERPEGIAQALILAENFLDGDDCTLILGDNFFFGHEMSSVVKNAIDQNSGATIFGYRVRDPERYGVISFDNIGKVIDIVEKPKNPPSSYAVTGLYIYSNDAVEYSKSLLPSARGELEITDLNLRYLRDEQLRVEILGRGFTWLDTGTPDALLEAAHFVQMIERRQGLKIGCPEEIAWRNGWINQDELVVIADKASGDYKNYLYSILDEANS